MGAIEHKRICAGCPRYGRTMILAICGFMALSGCASLRSSNVASGDSGHGDKRVVALEKELRRTQKMIDELRERNLVLEKRRSSRAVALSPDVPATPSPMPIIELAPETRIPTVENVGAAQTGEHFLYSKILETYRTKALGELQKTLQLLIKTYPDSVFADNALYLAGLLALEQGQLDLASKYVDRILKDYPRGNKVVAALFTRAVIAKRLNHFDEARQLFLKVRSLYRGSPEAERVGLELKLLELAADNRRES